MVSIDHHELLIILLSHIHAFIDALHFYSIHHILKSSVLHKPSFVKLLVIMEFYFFRVFMIFLIGGIPTIKAVEQTILMITSFD